jgi:hypothetical protein
MDANRFDRIRKAFTQRRLSRRATLMSGAAGLAAVGLAAGFDRAPAAQDTTPAGDATPAPDGDATRKIPFLFVQTFQSGSITPVEGVDGRYTLSLGAGTGQTIYFSDRPERIVGTSPTPEFLEGLGFLPDNPPNAALVAETSPGETDVAVVELFAPLYDPITQGVIYEVEVLANWQTSLELGFSEAPTDLAALAPSFGAAQLFIDDCPNLEIGCYPNKNNTIDVIGSLGVQDFCWNYGVCMPCEPYGHTQPDRCATQFYWDDKCTEQFASRCEGGRCAADWWWVRACYLDRNPASPGYPVEGG